MLLLRSTKQEYLSSACLSWTWKRIISFRFSVWREPSSVFYFNSYLAFVSNYADLPIWKAKNVFQKKYILQFLLAKEYLLEHDSIYAFSNLTWFHKSFLYKTRSSQVYIFMTAPILLKCFPDMISKMITLGNHLWQMMHSNSALK